MTKGIYGVAYHTRLDFFQTAFYRFEDKQEAQKWLHTESYNFATREIITLSELKRYLTCLSVPYAPAFRALKANNQLTSAELRELTEL